MKFSARTIFVMSLVAVGAYFAFGMQPAASGDLTNTGPGDPPGAGAPASTHPSSTSNSTPAGVGGMQIHIDPQTGALTQEAPPTAPLVLSPAEQNAFSTSHQGLVEVPSPVSGGGVIVNLQGRFQQPLSAIIDDAGRLTIRHLDPTSGSDVKK